jgi:hypothetical protein
VRLLLPMVENPGAGQTQPGQLVRGAGLRVILLAIQQEADALTGARHQRGADRQALRWSREKWLAWAPTSCFSKPATWTKKCGGRCFASLTTRNYPLVTRSFTQAYGIEKVCHQRRFIQDSRDKLKERIGRPAGERKPCAIVIDGLPSKAGR